VPDAGSGYTRAAAFVLNVASGVKVEVYHTGAYTWEGAFLPDTYP